LGSGNIDGCLGFLLQNPFCIYPIDWNTYPWTVGEKGLSKQTSTPSLSRAKFRPARQRVRDIIY